MMQRQDNNGGARRQPSGDRTVFPCPTCGRGFSRRKDLERHDQVHSGVRTHACDYPGCGKKFIQKSAVTVHRRVHTGEKPLVCELCGKSFGDPSCFGRHRRVHSGIRLHKCPYADCQKTFTRRAALTHHQNKHTGTVEEAAAATAAALATRGSNRGGQQRSDSEQYSNNGSLMSAPSPGQRTLPTSPNSELTPMYHPGDYPYMDDSPLSGYLHQMPNQSPPSATSFSNSIQPTPHPTEYGPPSIANMEQRQAESASGSPHIGNAGWQSHSQNMLSQSESNGFTYPEPSPYSALPQFMY